MYDSVVETMMEYIYMYLSVSDIPHAPLQVHVERCSLDWRQVKKDRSPHGRLQLFHATKIVDALGVMDICLW